MKIFNFVIIFIIFIFVIFTFAKNSNSSSSGTVTIKQYAGEGLDLKAVTHTAERSISAEDFEKKLNEAGNKINNLDLDEDNKVDYINVTEINDEKMKGFSLTVELPEEQVQEICTIQFEQVDGTNSRVQTHGNSHIYGHNHYYHRSSSTGSWLIMSYFLSRHNNYHSSYGRAHYPSHFSQNSQPVSKAQYSGFHQTQPYSKGFSRATSSKTTTPFTSPNRGKTASNIKAPLRNPSTSQKSFQKTNPSKSRTISTRSSSSFFSRSGSSFGGGK